MNANREPGRVFCSSRIYAGGLLEDGGLLDMGGLTGIIRRVFLQASERVPDFFSRDRLLTSVGMGRNSERRGADGAAEFSRRGCIV